MSIAEAKIFKNGRSQAVRLPKDFRMSGKSCYVKRFGVGVLLVPKDRAWSMLEESLNEFTDDFMNERDQGEYEKREPFR